MATALVLQRYFIVRATRPRRPAGWASSGPVQARDRRERGRRDGGASSSSSGRPYWRDCGLASLTVFRVIVIAGSGIIEVRAVLASE